MQKYINSRGKYILQQSICVSISAILLLSATKCESAFLLLQKEKIPRNKMHHASYLCFIEERNQTLWTNMKNVCIALLWFGYIFTFFSLRWYIIHLYNTYPICLSSSIQKIPVTNYNVYKSFSSFKIILFH